MSALDKCKIETGGMLLFFNQNILKNIQKNILSEKID